MITDVEHCPSCAHSTRRQARCRRPLPFAGFGNLRNKLRRDRGFFDVRVRSWGVPDGLPRGCSALGERSFRCPVCGLHPILRLTVCGNSSPLSGTVSLLVFGSAGEQRCEVTFSPLSGLRTRRAHLTVIGHACPIVRQFFVMNNLLTNGSRKPIEPRE